MGLLTALSFVQLITKQKVRPGDTVIDATVGNGIDTYFLAELVGAHGHVIGLDIQQQALERAQERGISLGLDKRQIQFLLANHADIVNITPRPQYGKISAILFNLGYLPDSDSTVITQAKTTLPALQGALQLIKKNGIVSVVIYSAHNGGEEEAIAIKLWAGALPEEQYQVVSYTFINRKTPPPHAIIIEKII